MPAEIYVSTDVETDGPIPGPHSMLSMASAAFTADGQMLSTFSANLDTLPGASGHPATMSWWQTQPAAWQACREQPEPPEVVMPRYLTWLRSLPGRPVFAAYPAAFDFMFVHWYLVRYTGESPFSHSALDIKSYAAALLGTPFRSTHKQAFPKAWIPARPHTHVALDDAIEQGELLCRMLAERAQRGSW